MSKKYKIVTAYCLSSMVYGVFLGVIDSVVTGVWDVFFLVFAMLVSPFLFFPNVVPKIVFSIYGIGDGYGLDIPEFIGLVLFVVTFVVCYRRLGVSKSGVNSEDMD